MSGPADKKNVEEVKKLQAVLITDSFNENFRPVTLESPRVLLPVVNIPLIEYSLEFLESNDIEEIFVFCCFKAKEIEEYILNSRWRKRVQVITSTDCLSIGDALRTINGCNVLKGEFVLCSGDIISNVKIGNCLNKFKEKREKDKSLVMDMFFKIAPPGHRTRTAQDDLIVGLDSATNQVLYYEDDPESAEIVFDTTLLENGRNVQLRHDLLFCGLFVCALEVLYEFEDNFDYLDIAKSFVADVLTSEISNYKISATLIDYDYAARVQDLKTLDSVSRDIVHRWTFPFVPDTNMYRPDGSTGSGYKYQRNSIYKARNVWVARSARLLENVVVGEDCDIGEGAELSNCTIGRGCTIGANVKIDGSYLWNNVVVGDNSTVTASLVAAYVRIGSDVTVSEGCVLSYHVEVGNGHTLPKFTRLTTCRRNAALSDDMYDEDDIQPAELTRKESELSGTWKDADVGPGGVGKRWPDESHRDGNTIAWQLITLPPKEGNEEVSSSEDEFDGMEAENTFAKECAATVRDGLDKNSTVENHVLEINSLKFSYDSTFEDCYRAFTPVLLEQVPAAANVKATVKAFTTFFTKFRELVTKFVKNDKNRAEFITLMTDYCDTLPDGVPTSLKNPQVFQLCLKSLYDIDILTEESVLAWAKTDSPWVEKAAKFIEWLEEADEDSEESEEESDDE